MPAWVDRVICALLHPDDVCQSYGLEIVFFLAWLAMIIFYRKHWRQFVGVTILLYSLYYTIALFWIFGDGFCEFELPGFIIPLSWFFC